MWTIPPVRVVMAPLALSAEGEGAGADAGQGASGRFHNTARAVF
jgi:hypothetical protein